MTARPTSTPASVRIAPTRTDGIRTIDDLQGRCVVDIDSGCWHWRGATTLGLPSMWIGGLDDRVTAATAIAFLVTGEKPEKGRVWHCTCDTRGCCNPEHRNRHGTRSTQMLAAKITRTPMQIVRMSAGRRAGSKLSEAAVADILATDDILSAAAARHGCSLSHISQIRRGVLRKPLAAPGSSVFNFGGMR